MRVIAAKCKFLFNYFFFIHLPQCVTFATRDYKIYKKVETIIITVSGEGMTTYTDRLIPKGHFFVDLY